MNQNSIKRKERERPRLRDNNYLQLIHKRLGASTHQIDGANHAETEGERVRRQKERRKTKRERRVRILKGQEKRV